MAKTTQLELKARRFANASDVATANMLENWIDETWRRSWFLYEMSRG